MYLHTHSGDLPKPLPFLSISAQLKMTQIGPCPPRSRGPVLVCASCLNRPMRRWIEITQSRLQANAALPEPPHTHTHTPLPPDVQVGYPRPTTLWFGMSARRSVRNTIIDVVCADLSSPAHCFSLRGHLLVITCRHSTVEEFWQASSCRVSLLLPAHRPCHNVEGGPDIPV